MSVELLNGKLFANRFTSLRDLDEDLSRQDNVAIIENKESLFSYNKP